MCVHVKCVHIRCVHVKCKVCAYMQRRYTCVRHIRVSKVPMWHSRLGVCAYVFIHIYMCANTHMCNVPVRVRSSCVGFALGRVRVFVYANT